MTMGRRDTRIAPCPAPIPEGGSPRRKAALPLEVRCVGFTLSEPLRDRAEGRIRFALSPRADLVERVVVHLVDEGGPRGGRPKACRVEVHLVGRAGLVVEARDRLFEAAVDRAAAAVSQALSQASRRIRQPYLPLGAEVF